MSQFRPFVPYRNRPLCFLDTETTGTKAGVHEVTEIGLRHTTLGDLCVQIAPQHLERAEYEALKISRYNTADWIDAKPFRSYIDRITPFFEDSTIIAHNATFDIDMLKVEYDRLGVERDHLFRDFICTMSLARTFFVPLGLNRIGMKACMEFIGEDYDDAHYAFSDVVFVEKLYNYIHKNLKWHGRVNGKPIQEGLF